MQPKLLLTGASALVFVGCSGVPVIGGGTGGTGGGAGNGAVHRRCDWVDTAVAQTGNPLCPNGTYEGSIDARGAESVISELHRLEGCTRITGSVRVIPMEMVDEGPSGLESLRAIEGQVQINGWFRGGLDSGQFSAADGEPSSVVRDFDNVRCVGNTLELDSFTPPFPKLVEAQGSVEFVAASNEATLPALKRIWGDVAMTAGSTPELLPAIETVYGYFPGASAHSSDNPRLDYIGCGSSFPACKDGILGCHRNFTSDAELNTLSTACRVAAQGLEVRGVSSLRPLQGLRGVRDQLKIESSAALTSLDGLNGVESADNLILHGLPNVTDLHGLEGLKTLDILDLGGNAGLTNLRALSNVRGVMGSMQIFINDLASLSSLEGLENITTSYHLSISGAPKLTSLQGLSGLKSVSYYMAIDGTGIADLHGLDQLTQVAYPPNELGLAAYLRISGNPKLQTLDGLGALDGTVDTLIIADNAVLRDLHGLSKLKKVNTLNIGGNPLLPECEVSWLAQRVGATNQASTPNGGSQNCAPSP